MGVGGCCRTNLVRSATAQRKPKNEREQTGNMLREQARKMLQNQWLSTREIRSGRRGRRFKSCHSDQSSGLLPFFSSAFKANHRNAPLRCESETPGFASCQVRTALTKAHFAKVPRQRSARASRCRTGKKATTGQDGGFLTRNTRA